MQEEYKPIIDFENYEISNFGNVRNIKTSRILKPGITKGYYYVVLNKNKNKKTKKIHRLVAETFIENPENKDFVDHVDNNRVNNDIRNLRWVTRKENDMNKKIYKNNNSGAKGITFNKNNNNWMARISINNVRVYLGSFDNFEDAKKARMIEANKAFGVYANDCEKIKKS